MIGIDYITAGRAVLTVRPPAAWLEARKGQKWHSEYRYEIDRVEPETASGRPSFFVRAAAGDDVKPAYLGVLDARTGDVRMTRSSSFPEHSTRVVILRRVLKAIWEGRAGEIERHGWTVSHNGRCSRCGRVLTTRASVAIGIGPDCYEMICAAREEEARAAAEF